jgi:hypothetical protein
MNTIEKVGYCVVDLTLLCCGSYFTLYYYLWITGRANQLDHKGKLVELDQA